MPDVKVDGAQIRDFARDLRAAGNNQLAKELMKQFRQSAKVITVDSRKQALAILPTRGGLASLVAKTSQRANARAGRTTATIEVIVSGKKKGSGATQTDAGAVRHPVFNTTSSDGRRVFVSQDVKPGWFTKTAESKRGDVEKGVLAAMDEVSRLAGL